MKTKVWFFKITATRKMTSSILLISWDIYGLSCDCARTFRSQCWQASIITAQLVGKIHIFVNLLTPTQTRHQFTEPHYQDIQQ